jgi:hypothetical protein
VLEDWSPSFEGLFLYYPGHRQVPVALRALMDMLRAARGSAPAKGSLQGIDLDLDELVAIEPPRGFVRNRQTPTERAVPARIGRQDNSVGQDSIADTRQNGSGA